MIKKNQNMIYSIPLTNYKESMIHHELNKEYMHKNYSFDIKIISEKSELLYNFKLSLNTECFFIFNTLYIVEENLIHPISAIADAVFFLLPNQVKDSDLLVVYEYIKESEWIINKSKLLKLPVEKLENKLFLARLYLFDKKINQNRSIEKFEKMMLKSRRIISKFKSHTNKEKDIDYLLSKGF